MKRVALPDVLECRTEILFVKINSRKIICKEMLWRQICQEIEESAFLCWNLWRTVSSKMVYSECCSMVVVHAAMFLTSLLPKSQWDSCWLLTTIVRWIICLQFITELSLLPTLVTCCFYFRSREDVDGTLAYAKLEASEMRPVAQYLQMAPHLDNDSIKLIELENSVLESLLAGKR